MVLSLVLSFQVEGCATRDTPELQCLFFGDVEAIADLEFVEPAFGRNEVLACCEFNRLLFYHFGGDGLIIGLLVRVPAEEELLHLGVFSFAAAAFLTFATDLHPPFERLEGH